MMSHCDFHLDPAFEHSTFLHLFACELLDLSSSAWHYTRESLLSIHFASALVADFFVLYTCYFFYPGFVGAIVFGLAFISD